MKEIINAVMKRLKEQVPELTWIDVNLGQMDLENPPVDYPCALIDIPNIQYSNLGNHYQTGEVNVEIELYFQVQTPSNMSMPTELREQALAHYDIVSKVYVALEGFSGENFGSLNRRRTTRNTIKSFSLVGIAEILKKFNSNIVQLKVKNQAELLTALFGEKR